MKPTSNLGKADRLGNQPILERASSSSEFVASVSEDQIPCRPQAVPFRPAITGLKLSKVPVELMRSVPPLGAAELT